MSVKIKTSKRIIAFVLFIMTFMGAISFQVVAETAIAARDEQAARQAHSESRSVSQLYR